MRSPEGGPREIPEKPLSPEPYDKTEWEKLKLRGPTDAIKKGRIMGVPEEEIDRFANEVIARETEKNDHAFVYRFRKNMGIGTEGEVRAAGERAYRVLFENRDFGPAMSMAREVYSEDSEEWRRANEANEVEYAIQEKKRRDREKDYEGGELPKVLERFEYKDAMSNKFWEISVRGNALVWRFGRIGTEGTIDKKEFPSSEAALVEKEKRKKKKIKEGYIQIVDSQDDEKEYESNVIISEDATFADLFKAIDSIEEGGLVELHFEEELYDQFDFEVAEEVLDFRNERADESATTKVLDFFEKHGYSEEDVSVYLPIKFKKN